MKFSVLLVMVAMSFGSVFANIEDISTEDKDLLNESLGSDAIEVGIGITNIYQNNVRGGLSTHNRRGRYSGSYDLEFSFDAEKLFGWESGLFYLHAEGSWTGTEGIDGASVGSYFGVNGDAAGDRAMDITELWYEQCFGDDFILRLGKMDVTGGFECRGCPVAFDTNMYANDETSQFLNNALVNNPTIPFPDNGLAVSMYYSPADSGVYIAGAVADAQADARETGFRTAFTGEDYYFYIMEAGFVHSEDANTGSYRFGVWYDPQPKANSDSTKSYRDDNGFYSSFDQVLTKENDCDDQGLGVFFRYGYAPSKTNDVSSFYSFGLHYQGLLEGREEDVIGVGFAQGDFSDTAYSSYTDDNEKVYELYYNAKIASNINVTPSLQYVVDPGGNDTANDAVVLGVRVQMAF